MTKPDPFLRAMGQRIATLRRTAALSQDQLADRARLSVKTISEMERGVVNPSVLVLRSVAAGLGVTLPRLITEPGQMGLEVEALLAGRNEAEQQRALSVLKALFVPLERPGS